MKKRQLPETSHQAYEKAKPMISGHHEKILNALLILGSETAEGIAKYLGMDHSQVNRRVSEMEEKNLIYRPGHTKKTSTGREAKVWTVRGANQPKTDKEANIYAKGEKASTDYSKELIEATKKHIFQQPLF